MSEMEICCMWGTLKWKLWLICAWSCQSKRPTCPGQNEAQLKQTGSCSVLLQRAPTPSPLWHDQLHRRWGTVCPIVCFFCILKTPSWVLHAGMANLCQQKHYRYITATIVILLSENNAIHFKNNLYHQFELVFWWCLTMALPTFRCIFNLSCGCLPFNISPNSGAWASY